MEELNLDEEKLNWFLSKFEKLEKNKDLFRAVKKLNKTVKIYFLQLPVIL